MPKGSLGRITIVACSRTKDRSYVILRLGRGVSAGQANSILYTIEVFLLSTGSAILTGRSSKSYV